MGRIKQGLDYFPLNTDLIHDRIIRRVMKREGDSAFTVLLYTLSYLYSGEGYYIRASDDFYDELADQLFDTDNDTVRRAVLLFVEYGFFDATLYERCGILTSADIQRQFLFITKRRNRPSILPDYCLVGEEEGTKKSGTGKMAPTSAPAERAASGMSGQPPSSIGEAMPRTSVSAENKEEETIFSTGNDVAETPDNVTETVENVTASPVSVTFSTCIKRKEKERIENILPNPPCEGGGEERAGGGNSLETTSGGGGGGRKPARKKRELTQEDIERMSVPQDGLARNFSGLIENLRLYHVPPAEQYAIVMKSNYGEIGGKVWQGFTTIRGSCGKIKLPGHYLLSVLNK